MRNVKLLGLALIIGAIGMTSSAAFATGGAALYNSKGCVACHGADGDAPISPTYPRLAGQNAKYLVMQMKEIKSGSRVDAQTVLMKPAVSSLNDSQIKAIAKWLSKQKGM